MNSYPKSPNIGTSKAKMWGKFSEPRTLSEVVDLANSNLSKAVNVSLQDAVGASNLYVTSMH